MSQPPALDRTGPVPIFQQLKAFMREHIVAGVWAPNRKRKAEADLAAEWGLSRGTVRKAIEELAEEGLLVRTHGRGTFVASQVVEQPLAERMVTFSEDLISKGIPFETQVLQQGVLQAHGKIATLLALATGARVFFLRRLRMVDKEPLIVVNNYVVYDRCPGIETLDFTHVRLFAALEEHFGWGLDYGRRSFQAQKATRVVAAALNIAQKDPVMYGEQLTFLSDGSAIEFSEIWLRGDRFKLTAVVKRSGLSTIGVAVAMFEDDLGVLIPS